jgi:hypothetical protein
MHRQPAASQTSLKNRRSSGQRTNKTARRSGAKVLLVYQILPVLWRGNGDFGVNCMSTGK